MRLFLSAFAMVFVFGMIITAFAKLDEAQRNAWAAERARPNIHNNAVKCRNHCHNAGLRVSSWDGAYPALKTMHGCRCAE